MHRKARDKPSFSTKLSQLESSETAATNALSSLKITQVKQKIKL